jgi:hypothetical protein
MLKRQLYLYLIGMGEPHQIDVRLDGTLLKRFTIGGEGKGMTAPESFAGNTQGEPQWEEYMHTADAGLTVRVPVTAGTHRVGVSFVRRYWEPEGVLQPPQRGFARTTNELYFGNPSVDSVRSAGPHQVRAPETPRPRRKYFICRPTLRDRRTVRAAYLVHDRAQGVPRLRVTRRRSQYAAHVLSNRSIGWRIRGRIQRGSAASSPRTSSVSQSSESRRSPPRTTYRISDLDLASRLSFSLEQHSDDELLSAATCGTL